MKEERRTLKEICEAYVKFKGLNMSAKEFYELSPTGELSHVFDALEEMKAAGHEIPRLEKECERYDVADLKKTLAMCNQYGCGHIVFADLNIDDENIEWCLKRDSDPDKSEHEIFENFEIEFLKKLLTLDYITRCEVFGVDEKEGEE